MATIVRQGAPPSHQIAIKTCSHAASLQLPSETEGLLPNMLCSWKLPLTFGSLPAITSWQMARCIRKEKEFLSQMCHCMRG
jgi:hypothetical protein